MQRVQRVKRGCRGASVHRRRGPTSRAALTTAASRARDGRGDARTARCGDASASPLASAAASAASEASVAPRAAVGTVTRELEARGRPASVGGDAPPADSPSEPDGEAGADGSGATEAREGARDGSALRCRFGLGATSATGRAAACVVRRGEMRALWRRQTRLHGGPLGHCSRGGRRGCSGGAVAAGL